MYGLIQHVCSMLDLIPFSFYFILEYFLGISFIYMFDKVTVSDLLKIKVKEERLNKEQKNIPDLQYICYHY